MKLNFFNLGIVGLFLLPAIASAKTFNCRCLDSGEDLIVEVSADGRSLSAKTRDSVPSYNSEAYVADLDSNYRPKVVGHLRFVVRNSGSDKTRIVIDGDIARGLPGKMRVEGNTDSYWSRRYRCQ